VRIISESKLVKMGKENPKAARYLDIWRTIVKRSTWRGIIDVRKNYPRTDTVKVASGRLVLVFDVCGNDYRLIVAAHFNTQIAFILMLLTHAEYSKDEWKEKL